MARKSANTDLKLTAKHSHLLQLLANETAGLTRAQILSALPTPMPVRTLNRRLQELVEAQLLRVSGAGRGTPYHLVTTPVANIEEQFPIPLSEDSREILKAISRPEQQRVPVPYHRELLDHY